MITVLLATRNGAETLGRTLGAFERLERPRSTWRLIAIDNGSTDGTRELLKAHREILPLTILREPRPGKSIALNRALPLVGEGLAVFVDDDILPNRDWLRAHEAAAAANPGHALFAGRILPCWDAEPPRWLLTCAPLNACFGIHDELPEGPCPHYVLYGGNMAVRAEWIRRGYRFDETFGPNHTPHFAMGGETAFVRRLAAAGCTAWYARNAVVRHIIPPEHLRPEWLFNRAANFGRGQYRVGGDPMARPSGDGRRTALRLRLAMAVSRWRALTARLRGDGSARFRALWRLNYLGGLAAEHTIALSSSGRASPPGGALAQTQRFEEAIAVARPLTRGATGRQTVPPP
jgi:glycosyltransferase involved in cell wall biosynthesis